MNGAQRLKSIAGQIAGSVCSWATSEQATTSGVASTGVTASSQMGRAVTPVPNPVNPETNPPANAPARTIREDESMRAILARGAAGVRSHNVTSDLGGQPLTTGGVGREMLDFETRPRSSGEAGCHAFPLDSLG